MHILIIEDEKRNFNRLKRLLEEIDGTFRIDGPLASIVEAVEWLQAHPAPELIFADIRLSLWYIIARKDESNVLRSLIDQMSLPQTRGCVTCIKSFPDVSGSRR